MSGINEGCGESTKESIKVMVRKRGFERRGRKGEYESDYL